MRGATVLCLAFLLTACIGTALAQPRPMREYFESRYISALPGGGFGVTPDGRVGFDGAIQLNIPVAYTPCRGNYVIGYWSGSTEAWRIHVGTQGRYVDGTGLVGAGFGKPGHGFYVGFMPTSKESEAAWNWQIQLRRDDWDKPAFAIGVHDWANQRDKYPGHPGGSRSFYGVATGRLGTEENFVYITLGWGGGRFNSLPFGGISWPFHRKFTLMVEYDGFNMNAGIAHSWHSRFDSRSRWNIVSVFALIRMKYPLLGSCLTYSR